jgi:hypothetical protein
MTDSEKSPTKWAFELTHVLNAFSPKNERFPVDVKMFAREFSHHKYPDDPISMIKGANLPTFDGGLFKAPSNKKGWGIIYNDSIQSVGRINYTLAHEFGHYLLHRLALPNGIQCGENDFVRWDSAYGQIEHQANVFASNLLMPLDDYKQQISPKSKIDIEMLSICAERYGVSFMAATLRWVNYTEKNALIVVSRDGFVLWARASKSAFRDGKFFRTSSGPPIPIPQGSLANDIMLDANSTRSKEIAQNVWFEDGCEEMVVYSELYNFTISVLQFPRH